MAFSSFFSLAAACFSTISVSSLRSFASLRMLLVTHEMRFAREVADHVVYLYQGRIEEQGPPAEVFGNPKSERLQQFLKSVS